MAHRRLFPNGQVKFIIETTPFNKTHAYFLDAFRGRIFLTSDIAIDTNMCNDMHSFDAILNGMM